MYITLNVSIIYQRTPLIKTKIFIFKCLVCTQDETNQKNVYLQCCMCMLSEESITNGRRIFAERKYVALKPFAYRSF